MVHDVKTRGLLSFSQRVLNAALLDCFACRARLFLDAYEMDRDSGFVDMLPVAGTSWLRDVLVQGIEG